MKFLGAIRLEGLKGGKRSIEGQRNQLRFSMGRERTDVRRAILTRGGKWPKGG